mgnify:CR=1 FL=1
MVVGREGEGLLSINLGESVVGNHLKLKRDLSYDDYLNFVIWLIRLLSVICYI